MASRSTVVRSWPLPLAHKYSHDCIEPFEDEIHPRLRFAHRGLVAMANNGTKNSNDSQFFITLGMLHGFSVGDLLTRPQIARTSCMASIRCSAG